MPAVVVGVPERRIARVDGGGEEAEERVEPVLGVPGHDRVGDDPAARGDGPDRGDRGEHEHQVAVAHPHRRLSRPRIFDGPQVAESGSRTHAPSHMPKGPLWALAQHTFPSPDVMLFAVRRRLNPRIEERTIRILARIGGGNMAAGRAAVALSTK